MHSLKRLNVRKSIVLFLFLVGLIPLFSCGQTKSTEEKILIVYLSRTKNTQTLAEIIHRKAGGDLVALELENPYPENYQAIVKQVSEELGKGFLPPLKTKVDWDKYDIVFIGFPTWAMQLPPPVQSFLTENNMKNKVLIPFNTNAGYGLGSSIEKIKELCPQADIKREFSMIGGKERDGVFLTIVGEKARKTGKAVDNWLDSLGVTR